MAGYDPSGNWITSDGRTLYPEYTTNAGGFWYALDDKAPGGMIRLPERPAVTNTDPYGPGGQYTTPDPLNPGVYWYRDAQYAPGTQISGTNLGGGLEKIDASGQVVGQYTHPNTPEADEGGRGWNLQQVDPATGGPTSVSYPVDKGGVFGLGPGWGSLVGTLLAVGGGLGLGYGLAAAAPLVSGLAGVGAEAAGGAIIPNALQYGAAIGPNLIGEAGAPALAGGGLEAVVPGVAGGAGVVGGGGSLVPSFSDVAPSLFASGPTAGAPLAAGPGVVGPGTLGPATGVLGDLAPYVPLISAGVQGVGGLIGAGLGASAAKNAAQTQADAARQANDTLWQMYQQNRADLAPYRAVGYGALADLTNLSANPLTYGPYSRTPTLDPAQYAFQGQPALDPTGYAFNAAQYQFNPPSGQQVLNEDPGYQFRVQQGLKALEQTGAARGGLVSGGQMKAAQQFGQDLASQEYQNAWQRAYTRQGFNTQLAQYGNEQAYTRALQQNQDLYTRGLTANQLGFERAQYANETEQARRLGEYQTNLGTLTGLRNLRYNELAGLAGTGQTAVSTGAGLGAQTAATVGGNITSAGAAQAAGQVGAANAIAGGFQGLGNAANSYLQYQLLNNYLAQRKTV